MRKKFRNINVPNTILQSVQPENDKFMACQDYPGTRRGVSIILSFQFSPPRVLYACELTNPPINPKKTYRIIITVANAPRLLGDRNPSNAKTAINLVHIWERTCGCPNHHEELRSRAKEDGQEERMFRRAKDVSVDQFPATILLHIFLHVHLIVPKVC